ncbi:hypothetical protein EBU58_03390 [bacterium]|nr:hypothetical protein [bacterium]
MAEQKKGSSAFTDAERAIMKERAREAREFKKLSGEEQVSRKIAEMSPSEKKMAKAIHSLVMGISPDITTKTWYGMPAYYFPSFAVLEMNESVKKTITELVTKAIS